MNTNLPISQADLEAMRIGPARAAAEMEGSWAMTVDSGSGRPDKLHSRRLAIVRRRPKKQRRN